MRDVFPGYYKPTKEELADLWANALVVLDTNALFNLFRYTNATREAFLKVLAAKSERLWLPHQVGLEFQRGRLGIIEDQEQAFTDLVSKSKAALANVTKDVGTLRNHPTLDLDELRETVSTALAAIEAKIEATRQKYQAEVLAAARHDKTTDMITDLYVGRVGAPYDDEKLAELCKVGATRYDAKKPPGYKDGNKPEPDRYGDLILWFQILDRAESDKTAVIFVGDDQKEDWWREFKGKKIGPRVELVDEFLRRTGKRIYFLTPHGLMELAKEYDDASISTDTVQEIAEVSEAQARASDGVVRMNGDRRLREEELFESMATPDVELSLRRLERRRAQRERSLRDRLGALQELKANGLEGSTDYASLEQEVSRHRGFVAAVSADIKAAEFELLRRRNPDLSGLHRWDYAPAREVELARMLLMRAGVPVAGEEDDWTEVSDGDIAEILLRHRHGVAPPAISHVLGALSDLNFSPHRSNWDAFRAGGRVRDPDERMDE